MKLTAERQMQTNWCKNYVLLLNETGASTAVFIIVAGSDGRARFWSQLNITQQDAHHLVGQAKRSAT